MSRIIGAVTSGSEGSSTVEFDELFPPRIDQLVESALQDQAREQQMLMETVQGAQREMKLLRELIERRDQAVVDLLEARLSGLASESNVERISELVGELREQPDTSKTLAPVLEEFGDLSMRLETLGRRLETVEKGL